MSNVQRIRLDLVANPKSIKPYPVDSGTRVDIGDLMWWDDDDAKPADSTVIWEATEAASRRKLARKFLGCAVSAKAATDTTITAVRIAGRGVAEFPVGTATTFVPGDMVSGDANAGSTALLAQSVEKTNDPQEAIGKVTKSHTSNVSTIHFEFVGRVEYVGHEADYYEIAANYGGAYSADTLPLGIVTQPGRVVAALFTCHTVPSAAASITIDIRKADNTSLLSAAAVLDPGVITAAGVHVSLPLNATVANLILNEGEALKVVFASASGTQGQDWSIKLRVKKHIIE